MSAKKSPSKSRHGKLADTTAQTSITMNKELLEKARAAAEAEGRSLSNWLEQIVKKTVPLLLVGFLGWHASRPRSAWTMDSMIGTAKASLVLIARAF